MCVFVAIRYIYLYLYNICMYGIVYTYVYALNDDDDDERILHLSCGAWELNLFQIDQIMPRCISRKVYTHRSNGT